MKTIIYCRKSTDRWDRQQLSIEAQEQEALKIAKREWLEVIKILKETQSAKEPWRPVFNEMMKLFTKQKADCIITWKLNRLARNPIDEWSIKWSLQSGIIKAIYTEWEIFKTWDNVLIMWMHFWMSTQYILDLQRDINRGIKNKIAKWWVCQKAPLWYINLIATKSIAIDEVKSEWVKEIFTLRAQNMSYKTISETLFRKWIKKENWKAFPSSTIETLLRNKFYIGLVKHNWEYYKWNYETFISKKLFERAQNIWKWMFYRKTPTHLYHLKWFLKDEAGYLLSGYSKKWSIYYKNNSAYKNNLKWWNVNINQRIIFDYFEKKISKLEFNNGFKKLNKKIILEILEKWKNKDIQNFKEINSKIKRLKEQKDKLLDLRIEWEIEKEIYTEKNNNIVFKIKNLESRKKELENNNIKEKINIILELLESLSDSYNQTNEEWKSVILKNLILELFVNNKKELSYSENSLLNSLFFLQNMCKNGLEVPTGIEPVWRVLQTRA